MMSGMSRGGGPVRAVRPSAALAGAREQARAVVARYGANGALVFGSVATGRDVVGSDLDLLVTPPARGKLLALSGIKADLEDLLGIEVDVVSTASTGALMEQARREAVPL